MPHLDFSEFSPVSKEEWLRKLSKDFKDDNVQMPEWELDGDVVNIYYDSSDLEHIRMPNELFSAIEPPVFLRYLSGDYFPNEGIPKGNYFIRNLKLSDKIKGAISKDSFIESDDTDILESYKDITSNILIDQSQKINELSFTQSSASVKMAYRLPGVQSSKYELGTLYGQLIDFMNGKPAGGNLANDMLGKAVIHVTATNKFYLDIVRLRAIRFMLSKILSHYDKALKPSSIKIIYEVPLFYLEDEYKNILSNTTNALSGFLGMSDYIALKPFQKSNPVFADRITTNVFNIINEESQISKVIDPAGGSYFFESLTYNLCKASWESYLSNQKN